MWKLSVEKAGRRVAVSALVVFRVITITVQWD